MKRTTTDVTCLKVITLGPMGAGKTCLLMKATNPDFICSGDYVSTIGVEFKTKRCTYNNTIPVKMQIWDTAGQERFKQIIRMYYRDVHAALFIFDLASRESFQQMDFYWKDFEEFSEAKGHVMKVLVGNKSDVEQKEVSRSEGEVWAQAHSVPYFETSAKTGEHIPELFDFLLQETMSHYTPTSPGRAKVRAASPKPKRWKWC